MLPEIFAPMLASTADEAFDSPDFIFEIKWDGVRVLAFCDEKSTRLISRTGHDMTSQYPEFTELYERIEAKSAVIDGEIFAPGAGGAPSFERLQQRINLQRPHDVARASAEYPVDLALFDVVYLDGAWVKDQPLNERIDLLSGALNTGDGVHRSDPVPENGQAMFDAAAAKGLEGIVAKKLSSRYLPGRRTRDWLKIKVVHRLSAVICGWSPGRGFRNDSFGSLILGAFYEGELIFIGSVGTGFTGRMIEVLLPKLHDRQSDACPFAEPPKVPGARWMRPELVADVDYREITRAHKLRAPSFKGLRADVSPAECVLETR